MHKYLLFKYKYRWHISLKKQSQREGIEKKRKLQYNTVENINIDNKRIVTQQEYYDYRSTLIGEVIFRSAQRSGVVLGVRKVEVQNAKCQENKLKIIVYDHKTGKRKPAVVFLEEQASIAFKIFLENFLPQVENNNNINEHFFISFKGNKITHEG